MGTFSSPLCDPPSLIRSPRNQAASNAPSLDADPTLGFLVGGDSSGASLTAILALKARDEGLSPPLTGQLLSVPSVVHHANVPEKYKAKYLSIEQNSNAPYFSMALREVFLGMSDFPSVEVWEDAMKRD